MGREEARIVPTVLSSHYVSWCKHFSCAATFVTISPKISTSLLLVGPVKNNIASDHSFIAIWRLRYAIAPTKASGYNIITSLR